MNPEQLQKLRVFEEATKARNQAKRVITSLEPIAEEAAQNAKETVEAVEKLVVEVEKATGWRVFFCCK